MRTTVLFALLVAVASAEYGWKPNSEYRYEVHSKTLASLNQVADLHTGVIMRAQVVVTPKTPSHLIVQIPQAEYSHVQANLPQGAENHIPEEHLKYQVLPLTKQPFEVKLRNGVVDEIVVSKEVPIWEVNVIKSVVSQLQVDTQGQRLIPSKLNMVPQGENEVTAVYKIMEDTVEGECEVLYDISPLPQYVLQRMPHLAPQPQLVGHGQFIDIVKTKNFTNCKHRPGYHFGLSGLTPWEPTANKMGNFLSRSSVTRMVISGNLKSYTIQSSVTTNQVILSPEIYNNQKGQVYSRVNLTLNSVHSAQGEQQGCTNPQTIKKLVYDFNSPWKSDQEARNRWDQARGTTQGLKHGGVSSSEESNERTEKHLRTKRSINEIQGVMNTKKTYGSGSSESTESIEEEEWHQETPTMTHAPEIPFLPYFVGYMGHSIQHAKEVNVNQVVKQLTEEISQQLQDGSQVPEKNTLDRFTILTRVIQTMNVKRLQQATQELYVKTEIETDAPITTRHYGWMTFRDAVVQAGTGPALMIIKEWILNGQIKGQEAAHVVATLPKTALYPNTEYMQTFFELVKDQKVIEQEYLNTSAIFAFTTLVRMSQVDCTTIHNHYPVHAFGRPTPKENRVVVEKYIPYFAQKLQHAVQEKDSEKIQVYIRALGNMAHPKILRVFEPYLEDKQQMTEYQRTLVVVSLLKLTRTHPRLARSVLYKTYANVGEAYQVRVAAVYNLMRTNPPANMLQRMAQFTHEDPSYQVSAAVKTAIRSAARLTGKEQTERRENAQAAVNLLTPKKFGIQYSHSNVTDYIVKGLNLGYTQYFNHIGSQRSLIPESVFYHLTRNVNGYKYISDKFAGMVSSVSVLRDLLDDMVEFGESTEKGSETGKTSETLEKIYSVLNLEKTFTKQLEGNVVFEWLGATRLGTFDNHTVESNLFRFMSLLHRFQTPRNLNYQKIYNEYTITIAMPTATGFPFVYTLNTPTLVSFVGKVAVKTESEPKKSGVGFVFPEKFGVEADIKVQYSTRTQSKITFITPFDHQHYIAGVDKNVQVLVPVKTKIVLEIPTKRVKVQIVSLDENKKYNLVHYSKWPYVSRHNILEFKPIAEVSNTHRIQVREPRKFSEKIGEQTGLSVVVQGLTERRYFDVKTLFDFFESHTIPSILAYPTHYHTIQHTIVDVVFDPQASNCKSIIFTAACVINQYEGEEKTQAPGKIIALAKPTKKEVGSQERLHEFVKHVRTGIKDAEPYVFDFGLEMQGGKPVNYVATVAYASSPIDDQTRYLMYFRKMENKNFEICLSGLTQMENAHGGIRSVEADRKATVRVEVSAGETCQDTPQVEIVGKVKVTPERKQYLQQLPLYAQAKRAMEKGYYLEPSQLKIVKEAEVLDNYHFAMKYHNVPEEMKNVTYKAYSIFRHMLYYYVSENPFGEKTQEGQAEMTVQFSPDLQSVRSYIHTPVGGISFLNVRVPECVGKILTPRRIENTMKVVANELFEGKYKAFCNYDNTQVRTFSNITYPLQIGKVWHVAMITKPQYQPVAGGLKPFGKKHVSAVLVREVGNGEKELKLVLGNENLVVEILNEGGNPIVGINGEKKPVQKEVTRYQREGTRGRKYTVVKYYVTKDGEVVVMAPEHDIKILYLGKSFRISLGPKNMKPTGGLCGARDGEKFYYMTPQGYVLNNPEQFVATWALSEEGRIGELKKQAQEFSQYRKEIMPSNYVSEQDAGRANRLGRAYQNLATSAQDYDSSSSSSSESNESGAIRGGYKKGSVGCTTKRIVTVEKEGKHCFSLNPDTVCTTQCHPEQTETKTGQFYCVEKSNTSEHWQKMIARGANPDFRNKGNTEEIQYQYPVTCTRN